MKGPRFPVLAFIFLGIGLMCAISLSSRPIVYANAQPSEDQFLKPDLSYIQEQLPEEVPEELPTTNPEINYSSNVENFRAMLDETILLSERIFPIIEDDAVLLENSVQDGQLINNEILPDLETDVRLMQELDAAFGQFMGSRNISYAQCLGAGICE